MTQYAFFEGKIRPIEQAQVSIMNQTFNYGTGAFGGLRGYWNARQEQLYVFRIVDHFRRFLQSTRLLLADLPYSAEELADITIELLSRENWRQDCYIRPIAYKRDESIGVRLHNLQDAVAIFSCTIGAFVGDKPISLGSSSWRRVDDTAIPARGKLIGSYMNSALVRSEAQMNGFDDALVLDQAGHVVESSVANIFMLRNGVLVTPPVYENILEGITRRSVIELASNRLGVQVVERPIDRSEIYAAEEVFVCGTGMQIAAVGKIDHRSIGNGAVGSITRQLQTLYFQIVRGEEPIYSHWLTPVPERELAR